jgi:hypothetical protein
MGVEIPSADYIDVDTIPDKHAFNHDGELLVVDKLRFAVSIEIQTFKKPRIGDEC